MSPRREQLPAAAYAAALAALPGAGSVGLGRLIATAGHPTAAWEGILSGRLARPEPRHSKVGAPSLRPWSDVAASYDVAAAWRRLRAQRIGVTWPGQADFPAALAGDPSPPAVLFWRGDLNGLARPCVALVGTRRATAAGRATAFELGHDLAAARVCVVSGLALGIDGAAHRGALAAGTQGATVGVAASGVDSVYPPRHRELWEAVVKTGAVVSETPPGFPAQAWRFPARNRIIAGLVSMVVVVESHVTGGSLITADAAIERGIDVRAVPGPVRSSASAGTNRLLFDGPGPVRDANDILDALGFGAGHPPEAPTTTIPALAPTWAAVLEAVGWSPTSFNHIVAAANLGLAATAAALDGLAGAGLVAVERDWWQRLG